MGAGMLADCRCACVFVAMCVHVVFLALRQLLAPYECVVVCLCDTQD